MIRVLAGRKARTFAVIFVALAVAAAGAAYAAGGSSGKISVCVHKKGGGLYKAKKCAKKDKSLSWNAQGPRGPKGNTGNPGAPGTPGTPGPAVGGSVSSGTISGQLGTTALNVMKLSQGSGTITAPANGTLLVTASGNFQKTDNTTTLSDADCTIAVSSNGGAFTSVSKGMIRDFHNPFENEELTATGGVPVVKGSTYDVAMSCISFNAPVVFVRGDMIATFVG